MKKMNRAQIPYDQREARDLESKINHAEEDTKKPKVTLSPTELEPLVALIVRHMIFSSYGKPGVPVKRTHLSELVLANNNRDHKHASKLLSCVLPVAKFKLLSVFGMEMCELEVGTAKEKEYVLLNALPTALREGCHINDRELPSFSLAMVILALLHLSDGEMKEKDLVDSVAALGLNNTEEPEGHPAGFFKIGVELQRLQNMRWLVKTNRDGQCLFKWGEAALAHITIREIEEFIEKEFKDHEEGVQTPTEE